MIRYLLLATAVILCTCIDALAQWQTKTVDNHLDDPYRIAFCKDVSRNAYLKLERVIQCDMRDSLLVCDTQVALYISGGYYCDENLIVDLGFVVGDNSRKFSVTGTKSGDAETVFILDDLRADKDVLAAFQQCSSLVVRVNESHCDDDYYKFNMTGSIKALRFITYTD